VRQTQLVSMFPGRSGIRGNDGNVETSWDLDYRNRESISAYEKCWKSMSRFRKSGTALNAAPPETSWGQRRERRTQPTGELRGFSPPKNQEHDGDKLRCSLRIGLFAFSVTRPALPAGRMASRRRAWIIPTPTIRVLRNSKQSCSTDFRAIRSV